MNIKNIKTIIRINLNFTLLLTLIQNLYYEKEFLERENFSTKITQYDLKMW